jgi:hypothetical protein
MREFLLGREWLERLVDRLDDEGWCVEQITDYVNAWADRAVAYIIYLTQEGYSTQEITQIVNSAVEAADFDLGRMPIVPSDSP